MKRARPRGASSAATALLAINGDARAAVLGYSHLINVHGGDTYRVDVERHGQRVSVDVLLPLVGGRYLWPIFQVCSLAFFICGAALGLLRPQDEPGPVRQPAPHVGGVHRAARGAGGCAVIPRRMGANPLISP